MYPVAVPDVIKYNDVTSLINYGQGLEIADKVQDYLKKNNASLVCGPGELSSVTIQAFNNSGDWVYHLNDTTLVAEIRPFVSMRQPDTLMKFMFAAAGRETKKILSDLQSILNEYQ